MEFAYVCIEGWIIDPYVQCFFDSSAEVLVLPPYNIEIFNGDLMTSNVAMVLKKITAMSKSLAYLKNIISAIENII